MTGYCEMNEAALSLAVTALKLASRGWTLAGVVEGERRFDRGTCLVFRRGEETAEIGDARELRDLLHDRE